MSSARTNHGTRLISYAQNAEDVVLLRAFRDNPGGVYVDVGAGHPVDGSLTKNLIDLLGWTGVDIEPQADLCRALAEHHPRSSVVECCVGAPGRRTFYRLPDNWGMGTLDPEVAQRHSVSGWDVVEHEVAVVPLDDVLEGRVLPEFELLKIDVEGAEREVLDTLSLDYWQPQVVVIEATRPATTEPSHSEWEAYLTRADYRLCLFDGLNRFYVSPSAGHLEASLRAPANIFDRFVPAYWWRRLSDEAKDAADPERVLARTI